MEDCIFCKLANGIIPTNIVYEDEYVAAFNDLNPQAPIHILVVPKKHYENVLAVEWGDVIISKIYDAINKIAEDQGFSKDGFRVINNCGKNAGQTVMHAHFHVLAGKELGERIIWEEADLISF